MNGSTLFISRLREPNKNFLFRICFKMGGRNKREGDVKKIDPNKTGRRIKLDRIMNFQSIIDQVTLGNGRI